MTRSIYLTVCLWVLCLISFGNETAFGSPPIAEMKESTVRVICIASKKSGAGSGFVIGKGRHVVTNWHVVNCTANGGNAGILIGHNKSIKASVIWKSEKKDLAILKLDKRTKRPAVTFGTSDGVEDAETVYALGFPGAADRRTDSDEVKISRGIISAFAKSHTGTELYQTDAAINPGNSGGPLFNEYGHVIGVNSEKALALVKVIVQDTSGNSVEKIDRVPIGEGIGWAIQTDELLSELETLGIPYDTAGITDHIAQLLKRGDILFPSAAVIIALISMYIASDKTRRQRFSNTMGKLGETVGFTKKRIERPSSANTGKNALLIGIRGEYATSEFPLKSGVPVIFGRDPSMASIVFSKDNTNISRRHAKLTYHALNNEFILEDMNSARGTFLSASEKIEPGRASKIKSGDEFYIASQEQVFQVSIK